MLNPCAVHVFMWLNHANHVLVHDLVQSKIRYPLSVVVFRVCHLCNISSCFSCQSILSRYNKIKGQVEIGFQEWPVRDYTE